ncbi:MAG TPA: hypothetical protein DC063_09875 [Arenimonas sp.]|nr:MAG: hypothetical protein A2X76_08985 [Xanthomonadales bacterium GWF1_69_6]HBD20346.1 hypothetical protein [Arenimonas sp.]
MKNVRAFRGLALTGVAALGLIAMTPAVAESDFDIGANPSVDARVDFEVIIPRFISFQVGSTGTTVDLVQFDVVDPTTGTPVARSNGGALTVDLLGNIGDIQIEAATTTLVNGAGDSLAWDEIDTTTADAGFPAPTLADGAIAPVTVSPAGLGRIVDRTSTWTYTYANSALVGAGTYQGTVTYTASAP